MTDVSLFLSEVMREAGEQGDAAEPAALLGALREVENPVSALAERDQAYALFEALYRNFSFLRYQGPVRIPIEVSERSRWAALIRWLLRELKDWRVSEDLADRKLVAMFIVAQACDRENALWTLMPAEIGNNSELVERLKNLIRSFSITFTSCGDVAVPIWEREAVETFNAADAKGDWVEIGNSLRALENQIFPNTVQAQSVRCLHRCGMDHLVDALAHVRQTVVAMQVAATLTAQQHLLLAVESDNAYVQFGCIYWTLSGPRSSLQFSGEERQLLTMLLRKVARDEARWCAWMCVFNGYPVRYPGLQVPLGHALVDVPEKAVEGYVNAIIIQASPVETQDAGRRSVAECLRAFRERAVPARRALLWNNAHERWSAWHFDHANPDAHLSGINWSQLDYAVVAFACECMDADGRKKAIDGIRDELQVLDERWHASVIAIVTAWNRLLSQFQPYAHASHAIVTGEDWLPETRTNLPFDPSTNEYFVMKYRLF